MPTDQDYDTNVGDMEVSADDENQSLADRLRSIRETVQRKETATRAEKRARARRINKGEPEGIDETVAVKKRKLGDAADEARGLVEDTTDLFATKTGMDGNGAGGDDDGDGFLSQAGKALDNLNTEAVADPMDDSGMEKRMGGGMNEPMAGDEDLDELEAVGTGEGLEEPLDGDDLEDGLF